MVGTERVCYVLRECGRYRGSVVGTERVCYVLRECGRYRGSVVKY